MDYVQRVLPGKSSHLISKTAKLNCGKNKEKDPEYFMFAIYLC